MNGNAKPSTQVKICNVAKHFMKVHHADLAIVNQVRGCQACGADNVPVKFLENHQNCSMENCKDITIKFVSTDATFFKSVNKTTSMKKIKKMVSRTMGVQPSEIRFCLNNKNVNCRQNTPAILLIKDNEMVSAGPN